MNRVIIRSVIVIMFLCFAGKSWGSETKAGPVDITLEPILATQWACYIQGGDLFIKGSEKTPLRIRESKEAAGAIMSPSLTVVGNSLYAVWIERGSGGSRILFITIHDNGNTVGKVTELAVVAGAMQVKLFTDSKERLFLLEVSSGEKPSIALHLSRDKGETFKRIPLEIDGVEGIHNPVSVVVNDVVYLFFLRVRGGKRQMGVKLFEIPSLNPLEYTILRDTEEVSFNHAFAVKGRPAVIYKSMRGGRFVLEGAVKGDKGWETFSVEDAGGLDIARLDYHAWKDGRVLVVFSGEMRERFKQRIYAAMSDDLGRNWSVRRIDDREFDNTRAWLPRMAVDGDLVAVVWEDSRDIRPGIRMKLSADRGDSWIRQDFLVSEKRHYAFRPRISFADGFFYCAWHQFSNDERKAAEMIVAKRTWKQALDMALKQEKTVSVKEKETLLKERVTAYWRAMMEKDHNTIYQIHDPFYRARVPFDYYMVNRGPMVYHDFNIETVTIEDTIASVKVKVAYDIPRLMLLGKETSVPLKEITTEDTYLYIDGTWYRKFVDAMSGGAAIEY